MKALASLLLSLSLLAITMLIFGTIWATEKSRERAACYRSAVRVEDCAQPNAFERVIRWINAPDLPTKNSPRT